MELYHEHGNYSARYCVLYHVGVQHYTSYYVPASWLPTQTHKLPAAMSAIVIVETNSEITQKLKFVQ